MSAHCEHGLGGSEAVFGGSKTNDPQLALQCNAVFPARLPPQLRPHEPWFGGHNTLSPAGWPYTSYRARIEWHTLTPEPGAQTLI